MNIWLTMVVNAEGNHSKDLFIHQIAKVLMWTILTWINVTNVKFQSEIEQYCQSNKSPCSQKDKRENNPYRPKKTPKLRY